MTIALALFGSNQDIIDIAAAAYNTANERKLQLACCLAAEHPQVMQDTLALLGLRAYTSLPEIPTETSALPALEEQLKKLQPTLLIAREGSPAGTLCQDMANRYNIELLLLPRRLDKLLERINSNQELRNELARRLPYTPPDYQLLVVYARNRENFHPDKCETCTALGSLASETGLSVIFPVNNTPEIQELIYREIDWHENVNLLEPQDPLVFLYLLSNAQLVLTDSAVVASEALELRREVLFVETEGSPQTSPEHANMDRVTNEAEEIEAQVREKLSLAQ